MTRSTSLVIVLLLGGILVTLSGCIMHQGLSNASSNGSGTTDISQAMSASAAMVNYTISPSSGRFSLNILRGEPFVINGTVNNPAITKVQVWILDGNISTVVIPVMPDGKFQILLDSRWTATLSRNYSSVILVQYPVPPDNFSVTVNRATDTVIETKTGETTQILSHLNVHTTAPRGAEIYPTTQVEYLEQGISATGNSDVILFLNGVDAWVTIDPVSPGPPGSLEVHGNTSLPAGSSLFILVSTISPHPTPKNYDSSHEYASGNATVFSTAGGVNRYEGVVDTSRLNTGKYLISVGSQGDLQANVDSIVDIIAKIDSPPENGNNIEWSRLGLPTPVVNESLSPVMMPGEWKIVPPGNQTTVNEIPYGSIIDCTSDGICRIFNSSGVEFLAVYNSNEAHIMEVPNGAMIDGNKDGNVTVIKLDDKIILTKIDENPMGS